MFGPGDRVKTHGFASENWNNKLGTVTKFVPKRDKYAVEFDEPLNGVLKQAVAECHLRRLEMVGECTRCGEDSATGQCKVEKNQN